VSPALGNVNLEPFLPELIAAGGLLLLLLLNVWVRKGARGAVTAAGGVILLAITAVVALRGDESIGGYLFDSVMQDGVTVFFRVFFCLATAISLGMLVFSFRTDGEPFLLMLSGVVGMFLLAGANDAVTLFVALELVSIPSYVLAGYKRGDARSAEAALKYVLFGAMSSGLLIYGLSLLYGLSGSTNISEMAARLGTSGTETTFLIALILVLAGIGYKVAMVPLHFWCPDVYEGSPTAVTAFFSVAPKAAGFAALLRLMPVFTPLLTSYGVNALTLFMIASAVTMTFGNLGAIWQTSLKRLLAYSSIAHAGYILMGFAVLANNPPGDLYQESVTAILFYLVAYLFMNLGAFWVVDHIERHAGGDSITYFRGLGRTGLLPALLLSVFLFSLTGIPPLAGFVGKFLLFAAAIKGKLFALAIIAALNTVVSLFYYVRVIRDMFLSEPDEQAASFAALSKARLGVLGGALSLVTVIPTLVLGLWWGPLADWLLMRSW
jgi:NADH-quinone oxidoreductase subunit N